jgi:hypothetical protein
MTLDITYTQRALDTEYSNILNTPGKYACNAYFNRNVLNFQQKEFYKTELALWEANDIYKDGLHLRDWLYKNRCKYIGGEKNPELRKQLNENYDIDLMREWGETYLKPSEILRGFKISGIHMGYSHFSPLWIKAFIEEYNIKSIYDPCGGWGHRLLGAAKIDYIYNDINAQACLNIVNMINRYRMNNKMIHTQDAAAFTPPQSYEAVFTCPPYWNTEIYTENGSENLTYDEYIEWWGNVIDHSIKPGVKYFAYVINKKYSDITSKPLLDRGYKLIKSESVGLANNLNHFQRNTVDGTRVIKNINKGELELIWQIDR